MVAAIEVYNKPRFDYRDEVFVILLINGWELMLKAVLSKAHRSIYYKKRRGSPYRTLAWPDALLKAKELTLWPEELPWMAIQANLRQLTAYRDNAVHFYNSPGFGSVVYGLAHTAIQNFNDLSGLAFDTDLADEITWTLMPLGMGPPIDPIQYLGGTRSGSQSSRTAVDEFLGFIQDQIAELEEQGIGTERFLSIFTVHLESTRTVSRADVVVGVSGSAEAGEPVYIERRVDPLRSHPLRRKNILAEVDEIDGRSFNSYDFQAVVHSKGWRQDPRYCWHDPDTGTTRWSRDVVTLLGRLSADDIEVARSAYAGDLRARPGSGSS